MPHPPRQPAGWPADLDAAFEELFDAFAHRPKPASPQMCVGHCVDLAEYEAFCRTAPRDLDEHLVDRYWSNQSDDWDLTTHFMPALLRAMPADVMEGIRDFTVTMGLNSRWPDLTGRERAAVESFCRAWFADVLGLPPTGGHTARRVLEAVATIGLDVAPYLAFWATVDTRDARWQLVDTVLDGPPDEFAAAFDRWLLTPPARAMIAECGRGDLSAEDLEALDVVAWSIRRREGTV